MFPAWVIGSLLVITLVHAVLVGMLLGRGGLGDRPGADRASHLTDSGLECPACGAVNQPEYRCCRECVSTLPGAPATVHSTGAPTGRQVG